MYNIYKPRVKVKEVQINNVKINYTSGFNAKYIKDNKIGPGTKINITLSGEVIPYIVNITKPGKPKFPTENTYIWNKTGVDIISKENTEDDVVISKKLENFVKTLKMKGVSIKTVERIVKSGRKTVRELLGLSIDNLKKIGFGDKQSVNIYNAIHNRLKEEMEMEKIMSGSNIFGYGFGVRKFKMILETKPKIFELVNNKEKLHEEFLKIDGMGPENVDKFVEGLPKFIDFFKRKFKNKNEIS